MTPPPGISWQRKPAGLKGLWKTTRALFSAIPNGQIHQPDSRVWHEDIFNHVLAIEEQRAKRSCFPFILMLLDANQAGHRRQEVLLRALRTVMGSTRDTDLIGWKTQARVLGIIFTQANCARSNSTEKVLRRKIEKALWDKLDLASAAKIAISTYVLPADDPNRDLDAGAAVALQSVSRSSAPAFD